MNNLFFVVEDDEIISNIVRHLLKKQGYQIHQADDGKKATDMIDQLPPPNLAILDIMLPYVDGFELIKESAKVRLGRTFQS